MDVSHFYIPAYKVTATQPRCSAVTVPVNAEVQKHCHRPVRLMQLSSAEVRQEHRWQWDRTASGSGLAH